MKKSNRILLGTIIFLFILLLIALITFGALGRSLLGGDCITSWQSDKKILGNEKQVVKEYTVTDFDRVSVGGHFHVQIKQAAAAGLKIAAEENILANTMVDVKDNQLSIGAKPGISLAPSKQEEAMIEVKELHGINLGGKNTLEALGINTDNLTVNMGGKSTGEIQGNIKNLDLTLGGKNDLHVVIPKGDRIKLNIAGKGKVYLSGSVNQLDIATGGEAMIDAKQLIAMNVVISSAGRSEVAVNASKSLIVSSAGDSNVQYLGDPVVSKTGVGRIQIEKITS